MAIFVILRLLHKEVKKSNFLRLQVFSSILHCFLSLRGAKVEKLCFPHVIYLSGQISTDSNQLNFRVNFFLLRDLLMKMAHSVFDLLAFLTLQSHFSETKSSRIFLAFTRVSILLILAVERPLPFQQITHINQFVESFLSFTGLSSAIRNYEFNILVGYLHVCLTMLQVIAVQISVCFSK